jgi:dUTPase
MTQISQCLSARLVGDELAQPTKVLVMAPTNHAVGYELFAAKPTTVPAGAKVVVPACWAAIPLREGTHARIAPKCELSCQKLTTGADSDCGVGVCLFNHSKNDLHVAVGDAVAQTAQNGMLRSRWLRWK